MVYSHLSGSRVGRLSEDLTLEKLAAAIPSQGGRKAGPLLRQAAREAMPQTAIVELGCWLGAGTAQLALGLRERNDAHGVDVHCFDYFQASGPEVRKAKAAGIALNRGQDTLPVVQGLLAPFDVPISYRKGSIEFAHWKRRPISVYVQDAGKDPASFSLMISKFAPSWVPGQTVLFLMDFYTWRKSGKAFERCQTDFVEANQDCFSDPEPIRGTSSVKLRYLKQVDLSGLQPSWFSRNALPRIRQALR